MIALSPGTVVAIKCWWGEHWGILAADAFGRATLISNRGVRGGVTEELWHEVIGNAEWRVVGELVGELAAYSIVERARSMIGTRYAFLTWNCQDLVYWALGLKPQSPQRDAAAALVSLAGLVFIFGVAAKQG